MVKTKDSNLKKKNYLMWPLGVSNTISRYNIILAGWIDWIWWVLCCRLSTSLFLVCPALLRSVSVLIFLSFFLLFFLFKNQKNISSSSNGRPHTKQQQKVDLSLSLSPSLGYFFFFWCTLRGEYTANWRYKW